MSSYGITYENLITALPPALQNDGTMLAIAKATATQLAVLNEQKLYAMIYARIEELPEDVLDELAVDFKVDWYDPTYMTLAEKRQTIESSWYVHRSLGTKASIERALSVVYDDSQVVEWYEYAGRPYHFKIRIDVNYQDMDPYKYQRIISLVKFYKNLRSILDEVEFIASGGTATELQAAASVGMEIEAAAIARNNN